MSFSEIEGQGRAKRYLKKALEGDTIPHAYLFTGTAGTGKTSLARALAMALNCPAPFEEDSCGTCTICRQIRASNFPDFLVIESEGHNIRIDQIRELNRTIQFAPVTGKYRVCVIRHAGTMTEEAANSFLKTLEEPPPNNIFILNVTEPRDLLPTIVSRCQKISFQPLAIRDVMKWLVERKHLDEEPAAILARTCGGSLGKAIEMWEAGFHEKRQDWIYKLISLPSISKEQALEMAIDCANEDKKKPASTAPSMELGVLDMLAVWQTWYRDLLVLKAGVSKDLVINSDYCQKLKSMAKKLKMHGLLAGFMMLDRAQRDLRNNRNTTLVLEESVLGLKRQFGASQ